MKRMHLLAAALLLPLAGLGSTAARADTQAPDLTTYTFSGVCYDCAGTATGTLTLKDYVAGSAITAANFVSFAYGGTNLFAPYLITAATMTSVDGAFDQPLPNDEYLVVNGADVSFEAYEGGGYWCTGTGSACEFIADYGNTSSWAAGGGTNEVPEPAGMSLLGAGVIGIGMMRARKKNAR